MHETGDELGRESSHAGGQHLDDFPHYSLRTSSQREISDELVSRFH